MLHNLKGTLHLQTFLFTYTVSSSYVLFATVDCFHFVEAMLYSNEKTLLFGASLSSYSSIFSSS